MFDANIYEKFFDPMLDEMKKGNPAFVETLGEFLNNICEENEDNPEIRAVIREQIKENWIDYDNDTTLTRLIWKIEESLDVSEDDTEAAMAIAEYANGNSWNISAEEAWHIFTLFHKNISEEDEKAKSIFAEIFDREWTDVFNKRESSMEEMEEWANENEEEDEE